MKVFKKILVTILCVLLSICSFVFFVLGGLNLAKLAIYKEYYSVKTDVCKNPGLKDGFVCQGIAYVEEEDKILVCGYMADHTASRIYVTDKQNNSYYVTLKKANGKDFTGHAGGVTYVGNTVYVASDDMLSPFSLSEILSAENGAAVTMNATPIQVNNQASFVYSDDSYLYVGEFHDGKNYITYHPYETPNGTNYAIVERYAINDLSAPDRVYSIPNKVQGFCMTPSGKMILSTSYGLADSHYFVYDESEAFNSGLTFEGAPVYFLGECKRDIKGPAMAEGLDMMDGKVITLTESASNKYIFGKFFFADQIVALDIA